MIVGLDFDNTIACYDSLFHRLATEHGVIPPDLPCDKTAVRDFLREQGNEDTWTELQGLGYGPRIIDASPYPGAVEAIEQLAKANIETHIVSHKTKHPYRGEPHDLHAAARAFLERYGISPQIIPAARVHLCPTKEAKLQHIAELRCTHFLDDLPEFLAEATFPTSALPILFDPADRHAEASTNRRVASWAAFTELLTGALPR